MFRNPPTSLRSLTGSMALFVLASPLTSSAAPFTTPLRSGVAISEAPRFPQTASRDRIFPKLRLPKPIAFPVSKYRVWV